MTDNKAWLSLKNLKQWSDTREAWDLETPRPLVPFQIDGKRAGERVCLHDDLEHAGGGETTQAGGRQHQCEHLARDTGRIQRPDRDRRLTGGEIKVLGIVDHQVPIARAHGLDRYARPRRRSYGHHHVPEAEGRDRIRT